jgi:hypothetical protein
VPALTWVNENRCLIWINERLAKLAKSWRPIAGWPMRFRVLLELASCREFPDGNRECGYDMLVPPTADHRLDLDGWQRRRHGNPVRRFWREQDARGELRHDRDGWFLAFGWGEDREEAVFARAETCFAAGERVAITEYDGQTRLYRVVALSPELLPGRIPTLH